MPKKATQPKARTRKPVARSPAKQIRKARRRTRRQWTRYGLIAFAGLIGLLVIIGLVLPSVSRGISPRTPAPGTSSGKAGTQMPDQGAQHIPPGTPHSPYNTSPPTSGWHLASAESWGIRASPIEDERQVHNLEHGGVLIQYNTQDQDLISKLEAFAKKQPNYPCYLIVAPYLNIVDLTANARHPIALTAWRWIDYLDTYDEERIQAFIDARRDKGPEKVACRP
ncbi:MAG: DUF3105 domain-containing protein [Chloroflexi bacterium]|nr:DUF3105 domain-containing protein [Chloroflexota bacterium]